MKTQMIDIPMAQGSCDTYIAYPEGKSSLPIVLLYMDAIGLRKRIFDMADQLASEGYFVMAPNIFYRSKRSPVVDYDFYLQPQNLPELFKQVMPMAGQMTPETAKQDVEFFLKYARSQPQVNPHKVGATGYCLGGGQALRAAGNYPKDFQAAASFHAGNLATDAEASPHNYFKTTRAEVYIGHADQDPHMPPEQIVRVEAALKEANLKYTMDLYEGCRHGWTMSDLPAYNPQGEALHWKNLFSLLSRTLKN